MFKLLILCVHRIEPDQILIREWRTDNVEVEDGDFTDNLVPQKTQVL